MPLTSIRKVFQDNSKVESLSKKLDAAEKKNVEYLQLSGYSPSNCDHLILCDSCIALR